MTASPTRILYVGLDARTEEGVTAALDEKRVSIETTTVAGPTDAMGRLESRAFDCVVSSGSLDDGTGIELLRTVRKSFPALPYVLFAETLSDELVSEAIEAGVTDYLPRKQTETRFSLVADRILDVIRQHRATESAGELERINTVVRDIDRALVRASTPREVDTRICEIISHSAPYVFAWIGEHDSESEVVTGRAAAGVEEGYLGEITVTTDGEPTAQGPTGQAVNTHEIQILQNIPENSAYEPWRKQALERGYQSSAAIPLVYDGTLYGVLNVYADRTDAFDSNEQELLEELGDTIAYAHHEIQIHTEARRFQQAVEQAADAIFITDTDGDIEYVNPAFEDLTGYTASEAVGENPRILKSGEHPEEYYETMWETILEGDVWASEIINTKRSGEPYYAEQTVAPIEDGTNGIEGFVAIQRDITDRKERERRLRRFEAFVENSPTIVTLLDTDGTVRLDKSGMDADWRHPPEEFLETNVLEYVHPDDRERVTDALGELSENPGEPTSVEFRFEGRDDEWHWLKTSAVNHEDDPLIEGIIAISIDVSERIDRTQQLRVMDRVLRHNLRNDMTAIQGNAEAIRTAVDSVDEEAETIVEKSRQLMRTVEKEREIVEVITERPDREEIDLAGDVCQPLVAQVRDDHPEAVIEFTDPGETPVLARKKIGRAIEELLENAIVHNDRKTPEVSLTVEPNEETIRVEIADNGPGIPEEEVNVLTREYEIEPLYHGSGLGLWLVNWIVRLSGGTLSFEGNDPRGSVVTIELQRST